MVEHKESIHRFIYDDGDAKAFLSYSRPDAETIRFTSTYVPPEFEGQGIGKKLVEAGIDFAVSQNLLVQSSCSFVTRYLERKKHKNFNG